MANTPNLDLVKPAGTDQALISVLNSNSDKIDAGFGSLSDQITTSVVSNVPFRTGVFYCTASQTIGGITIPSYSIYECHVYSNDGVATVTRVDGARLFTISGSGGAWTNCIAVSDQLTNFWKNGTITPITGYELSNVFCKYSSGLCAFGFGYYKGGASFPSRAWTQIATISPAPSNTTRTSIILNGVHCFLQVDDSTGYVKIFNATNSDIVANEAYFNMSMPV